jgi:3',5'-cyclic AMP phosphodiesterase CpdA
MRFGIREKLILAVLIAHSLALFSVSAFFSDPQSFYNKTAEIVHHIIKYQPETVFVSGDITNYGNRTEDFEEFLRVIRPLTKTAEIYPALGNHDKDIEMFLRYFPQVDSLTYYTVDRDGVVWIILNSNLKLAPGSVQYNWLVERLEENRDRTVAVMMHHPVYSSGPRGDEKGFRTLFPALFSKYSVAAVFSGHDHFYERSGKDGIHYVVFGGGGYPLYKNDTENDASIVYLRTHGFIILRPENGEMLVKAFNDKGELIDEFSFAIKPMAETPAE